MDEGWPWNREERERLVGLFRGGKTADVIFVNGQVVNVLTGEILRREVVVKGPYVAYVGKDSASFRGATTQICDVDGAYIVPGLLDAHLHIESSMLTPSRFGEMVLQGGVTGVFFDPHEIANVAGLEGVLWMLDDLENSPLRGYLTVPSCIPASSEELETTGATFGLEEVKKAFGHPRAVALGEMMNFPGVLGGQSSVFDKLQVSCRKGKVLEGHASGLYGRKLAAYLAAGIDSDHEAVTKEQAMERARNGCWTYLREGSGWADLEQTVKAVTEEGLSPARFCLVTDDRDPLDLRDEGGVDHVVRRAIQAGLEPLTALRMATINPATRFGLSDLLGSVSPGRYADLVLVKDLERFQVMKTYVGGKPTSERGHCSEIPQFLCDTVNLDLPLRLEDFNLRGKEKDFAIGVSKSGIVTELLRLPSAEVSSEALLHCAVLERHHGSGEMGRTRVAGFGLQRGALASTVAHDSHNLIVLGDSKDDMLAAVNWLVQNDGGQVAVCKGEVIGGISLPAGGLMSSKPPKRIARSLERLKKAVRQLGPVIDEPMMILSSLALPVIPEARITDKGLVNVEDFELLT
ncbi:MAG: adenine deaminase [Candidatus Bipolaricaulota bacterium]